LLRPYRHTRLEKLGEGKTTYTFSISVNAFSVEFPLVCYQQAGRVWYISGALRRTYTLFYPAPRPENDYLKVYYKSLIFVRRGIPIYDSELTFGYPYLLLNAHSLLSLSIRLSVNSL